MKKERASILEESSDVERATMAEETNSWERTGGLRAALFFA